MTFGVAIASIVLLLAAKQVKRRVKSLKRFPEALFLVVFFILVSHYGDFSEKGVKAVSYTHLTLPTN